MNKPSLIEQEIKIQEQLPLFIAAIAPVFLRYFLDKSDLLGDLVEEKAKLEQNPELSAEEKLQRSNYLDLQAELRVNNLVTYRTQMLANTILQSQFPDLYAAHAQQASQTQNTPNSQNPDPEADVVTGSGNVLTINPAPEDIAQT